ncbi:DUF3800 domain-containing protein [Plantactinospora solaniradicis]|uniref:DUF3800 domain-containing protein n=1 Tax=Plantactinospora solaniradicis TaxID=1723736 RepID=A0ABW1K5Z9_9ACTN
MELACDESGSEGERLLGGVTDVFAHASVRLTSESATDCIAELRSRIRSPATEYKANHLLREKHRPVLTWLLGPTGPIHGRARVHLTEKTFFVVRTMVNLLVDDLAYAATLGLRQGQPAGAMAATLYREGSPTFGRGHWETFLESFNYLLRPRNRRGVRVSVDAFYDLVDLLRSAGTGSPVEEIIGLLPAARPRMEVLLARLRDNPRAVPALNPMLPAIVSAVTHWGAGGEPVSIVHDTQSALTAECVAELQEVFGKPDPTPARYAPAGRLTSLTFVDSHLEPRVQVADFLAGTARKIASEELHGRGDAELTALLRPYVDPGSIWGDEASWFRLAPPGGPGTAG